MLPVTRQKANVLLALVHVDNDGASMSAGLTISSSSKSESESDKFEFISAMVNIEIYYKLLRRVTIQQEPPFSINNCRVRIIHPPPPILNLLIPLQSKQNILITLLPFLNSAPWLNPGSTCRMTGPHAEDRGTPQFQPHRRRPPKSTYERKSCRGSKRQCFSGIPLIVLHLFYFQKSGTLFNIGKPVTKIVNGHLHSLTLEGVKDSSLLEVVVDLYISKMCFYR